MRAALTRGLATASPGGIRTSAARAAGDVAARRALRDAWRAFWTTRLFVAAVAIFSAAAFDGPDDHFVSEDEPRVTQPFGEVGDAIFAPLARWDAAFYLEIANDGYPDGRVHGSIGETWAFFPLYPLLVRILGLGLGPHVLIVVAYAVSLAALLGALYLLHRLVTLEIGERYASATVVLLATFPASLFLGAPFTESLFLLLSVGAFYAARTGHWAWAGVLAGAASGTRSSGVVLALPLVFLYLYGPRSDAAAATGGPAWRPRFPVRGDLAWLALAPVGLLAFIAYQGSHGDALRWAHVQAVWSREWDGVFGAVVPAAELAWSAFGDLLDGTLPMALGYGQPVQNLILFPFLVFAAACAAGVLHRLPLAYGLHALASLALPLSNPSTAEPLMSFPRFVAVMFPLFMWLALVCAPRRLTLPVALVFAVLLGAVTSQFAQWEWFA